MQKPPSVQVITQQINKQAGASRVQANAAKARPETVLDQELILPTSEAEADASDARIVEGKDAEFQGEAAARVADHVLVADASGSAEAAGRVLLARPTCRQGRPRQSCLLSPWRRPRLA